MEHLVYARLFGLVSVILAFGILFNLDSAKRLASQMVHNATGYIMGAVLPLIVGGYIIVSHNVWVLGWPSLVTIVGWLMFLLGCFRALFADLWLSLLEKYQDKIPVMFALIGLIIGILLLYVGFLFHHSVYHLS